jgi:hypothetical protein
MDESNSALTCPEPVSDSAPPEEVTLEELLEEIPLHSDRRIAIQWQHTATNCIGFPGNIEVHCDHPKCGGVLRHSFKGSDYYSRRQGTVTTFYSFVSYDCTNCTKNAKVFGVRAIPGTDEGAIATCRKIYQEPQFGTPIPKRLFQVIGESNRNHFLQARRAIARGLGIGAYAYYRRIVENTKFDLVGSVLEVAQATNALPGQIELLKSAQSETQFSKAIVMLRDASAIPGVLLIDGQNPLALLHDLLSVGIHKLSDQECLERAQDAEVIVCEIAERMATAITERKAVKAALSNIMKRKNASGEGAAIS